MKRINNKSFFGIPWIICTVIALVIAVIYFYIWPQDLNPTGLGFVILRYGHSLVWVFLMFAAILMQFNKAYSKKSAMILAKLSLVIYAVFMATLIGYSIF